MGKYLKLLGILEFIAVGIYFIVLAAGGFAMASLVSNSSSGGSPATGIIIVFILVYLLFAPAPGALLYAVGAVYDNTRKSND